METYYFYIIRFHNNTKYLFAAYHFKKFLF